MVQIKNINIVITIVVVLSIITISKGQNDSVRKYSNSDQDSVRYKYKDSLIVQMICYYQSGKVQCVNYYNKYGEEYLSILYYEDGKKKRMVKNRKNVKYRIIDWDEKGKVINDQRLIE